MKKVFLFAKMFLINILLYSQTGELKITVVDEITQETLPFVSVTISNNSTISKSLQTNIDGVVVFKDLRKDTFEVKAIILGYNSRIVRGVFIEEKKTKFLEIKMKSDPNGIKEIVITNYCVPIVDADSKAQKTITRESYQSMAAKNPSNVVSQVVGVFQRDDNSSLSIKGGRSEPSTKVFIDGLRIIGGSGGYKQESEEYKSIIENDFQKVSRNPLSTFSIDVDRASYSNVRRIVNDGFLPPIDAVRIEEMINYFEYDYPTPVNEQPFSINMEYSICPWNIKNKLVLIGLQGKKIENEKLPANNLVFLIDVSGSMSSPDKLPLLKTALEMLIENLRPIDNVAIVVYAGAAGEILPSTSASKKNKILEAINNLNAGGSTAGGQGIELAYKIAKRNFINDGNNRVILATDGDFNVGVSSDEELIKLIEEKRNQDIFLSVLGFGTGNLKDSKMEQLANKGNGNYAYIDNLLEAKKVLVKEMGSTLFTIAKDVKIQVEFNPSIVKSYRLVGYENRKLNDEDFNDDTKDAGEIGAGHTVTALYEIVTTNEIENDNKVDSLKYQNQVATNYQNLNELLTIKFRYKEPIGKKSKLITQTLNNSMLTFENASENFKFSSMVAAFGQNLRVSKYKGNLSYKEIVQALKQSKGLDQEGYRAELIRLVETTEIIDKKTASSR